jgi:DNA-binding transcriptional LysR family regulator
MTENETKFMDSATALARALHFTKAAKRLRISQPMLTKNIQELEDILGFQLFERDRKKVAINDAGRAYIEQAELSLMYAERAFEAARAAMRGVQTILRVGRSPYTDPFLISTLHSVQLPLHPKLKVELSSQYSCELTDEILAGALDLAIVTQPEMSPLLTTLQVSESPFYIAMSKSDELAAASSVSLDSLSHHCWILFERRLHPPLYDQVLHVAQANHVTPREVRHITAPEEAFPLVAEGNCVAFVVKAGALLLSRDGVTVRPLCDPELTLRTYLASRADNESKLLSEFVRAYMRKLAPLRKEVQRALPFEARRTA